MYLPVKIEVVNRFHSLVSLGWKLFFAGRLATNTRLLYPHWLNQSSGQVFCLQNSIYFSGVSSVQDLVINQYWVVIFNKWFTCPFSVQQTLASEVPPYHYYNLSTCTRLFGRDDETNFLGNSSSVKLKVIPAPKCQGKLAELCELFSQMVHLFYFWHEKRLLSSGCQVSPVKKTNT